MEWTKDKPTVGGWYYYWEQGEDVAILVFVQYNTLGIRTLHSSVSTVIGYKGYYSGWWYGPLEPPIPPSEP